MTWHDMDFQDRFSSVCVICLLIIICVINQRQWWEGCGVFTWHSIQRYLMNSSEGKILQYKSEIMVIRSIYMKRIIFVLNIMVVKLLSNYGCCATSKFSCWKDGRVQFLWCNNKKKMPTSGRPRETLSFSVLSCFSFCNFFHQHCFTSASVKVLNQKPSS